MAAPSRTRSVVVTVGAIWRFRVDPTPPRPPRLSVEATIGCTVISLVRFIFGAVYLRDCPQQPNIPSFLLGLALIPPLMTPFVTLPCESDAPRPPRRPGCVRICLMSSINVFIFAWILAGDVWVFSVYQPNFDPTAADGLYCNKTLYTFAFWNAVWETFMIFVILAKLCRGLMCCVMLSPAPVNRDFYRNV